MKFPIKLLAIVALFFTFQFAANAQRGGQAPDPEKMAERQTEQMAEKLELDAAQTAKVKEINLAYAKKMEEARTEHKGDRDAMKLIGETIQEEKGAELKVVLTDTQFKAYEEMETKQAKRGAKRGGRGKGDRPGGK